MCCCRMLFSHTQILEDIFFNQYIFILQAVFLHCVSVFINEPTDLHVENAGIQEDSKAYVGNPSSAGLE